MLKYRLTAEIDTQLKGIAIELPIHPEFHLLIGGYLIMTHVQHHNNLCDCYKLGGIMAVIRYINNIELSVNKDHGVTTD